MSSANSWVTLSSLLDELEQQLIKSTVEAPSNYNTFDLPILLLYSRCRALFKASLLLINNEYPEEALGVGRSLFEASIELQQMAQDIEISHEYSAWWFARDLKARKKIDSTLIWLKKGDVSSIDDRFDEEAKKLDDAIRRNGLQKRQLRKADRNLATRLGREADFWLYELAHNMVHGHSQASFVYRKSRVGAKDENKFVIGMKTVHPYPKALAGLFVGSSMLVAHESATELIKNIKGLPTSSEFRARLDQILHKE